MSFDAGLFRRHMKAWRAVDSVAVEQRHSRTSEVRADGYQLFRKRRAFQKAESRTRVEFNVVFGHNQSVIYPLNKPSIASQIPINSIQCSFFLRSFRTSNGDIPLVASPTILSPPVT